MTKKKIPLKRRIHGMMFRLPLMITCEEFEVFINDYLENSLPPYQQFLFEIHLKMCRECRDYLERYEDAIRLTKGAVSKDLGFDAEEIPEDLVRAVLTTLKK